MPFITIMYIAIGRIVGTSGVEGIIKATAYSGIPERFLQLKSLYVFSDEGYRGYVVKSAVVKQGQVLLQLKGITTREAAKALVGKEIFVPEDQRIEPPEGYYFLDDIVGLTVFDTAGNKIGKVTDVIAHAANEVYVVREGDREVLIPAVRQFVKEINIPEGRMVVELIEGMLEE